MCWRADARFFSKVSSQRVIEFRPFHPMMIVMRGGLDVAVLLLPPHSGTGGALSVS